jgi:uncharacterized protein YdaU (DUF1376 family)
VREKLPWYKRYPANFITGTLSLSAEEKGVYSTLLDMLYDRGSAIEDSPRDLGRICGTSTRRFGIVRDMLLRIGKLLRTADGRLSNAKFEEEIAKTAAKRSGKKSRNFGKKKSAEPAKINGLRGHRIQNTDKKEVANATSLANAWPQNYRAEFWEAYRLKVGKRAALKALEKIEGSVEWAAIARGLERYQAWLAEPGVWRPRQKHAATWINGEHWNDELQQGGDYEQRDRAGGERPRAGDAVLAAARRRAAAIGEREPRAGAGSAPPAGDRVH